MKIICRSVANACFDLVLGPMSVDTSKLMSREAFVVALLYDQLGFPTAAGTSIASSYASSSLCTDVTSSFALLFATAHPQPPFYMIGVSVEIDEQNRTVAIHQRGQVKEKYEKFNQETSRPVQTPMEHGVFLERRASETLKEQRERFPYREAIGGLSYLARMTRPDLSQAFGLLGRFNDYYDASHWKAVKRVYQ